jgi:hypothetical protein
VVRLCAISKITFSQSVLFPAKSKKKKKKLKSQPRADEHY